MKEWNTFLIKTWRHIQEKNERGYFFKVQNLFMILFLLLKKCLNWKFSPYFLLIEFYLSNLQFMNYNHSLKSIIVTWKNIIFGEKMTPLVHSFNYVLPFLIQFSQWHSTFSLSLIWFWNYKCNETQHSTKQSFVH